MTGEAKVRVTGEPLRVTHSMGGSVPTLSLEVDPPEAEAEPEGRVTGTGLLQELPLAVTMTLLMALPSSE